MLADHSWMTPQIWGPASPGLAHERDRLRRAGLSVQVVHKIQAASMRSLPLVLKALVTDSYVPLEHPFLREP